MALTHATDGSFGAALHALRTACDVLPGLAGAGAGAASDADEYSALVHELTGDCFVRALGRYSAHADELKAAEAQLAQPTRGETLFARSGADAVAIDDAICIDFESNYNLAIKRFLRSLPFVRSDGAHARIVSKLGSVYHLLGIHYIESGRFTKALQHFKQGSSALGGIFRRASDWLSMARTQAGIADALYERLRLRPADSQLSPDHERDYEQAVDAYTHALDTLAQASSGCAAVAALVRRVQLSLGRAHTQLAWLKQRRLAGARHWEDAEAEVGVREACAVCAGAGVCAQARLVQR